MKTPFSVNRDSRKVQHDPADRVSRDKTLDPQHDQTPMIETIARAIGRPIRMPMLIQNSRTTMSTSFPL